jgi:hypothetical protein
MPKSAKRMVHQGPAKAKQHKPPKPVAEKTLYEIKIGSIGL